MKCYNYSWADAVGICKFCNKALCKECIVELEGVVACAESCSKEFYRIKSLADRTSEFLNKWRKELILQTILFGSFGIFILGLSLWRMMRMSSSVNFNLVTLFVSLGFLSIAWSNYKKLRETSERK